MGAVHGELEFDWADGRHKFNISKIGQVLELQDKCGCGVGLILQRLRNGTYWFNDFREAIRLALIGGGMSAPEALTLVKRYVDERPWTESILVAQAIIYAAAAGEPDEGDKDEDAKKKTAEGIVEITPTAGSSAPNSTAPEPR